MKNNQMIVGSIALAVITGGVGFWGGTMYSRSKLVSNFANNRGEGRNMMQGQNPNAKPSGNRAIPNGQSMMGLRPTAGEVTAKDDKSITIKMNDGGSRIIILSDKTTYRISDETSIDKVALGTKVTVYGESGTDGSMTATSIDINPNMMGQTLK